MMVSKEMEKAMKKGWRDWHGGFRPDEIPTRPSPSFERGFQYGVEFVERQLIASGNKKKPLIGGAW
jgi:hypothetical protein